MNAKGEKEAKGEGGGAEKSTTAIYAVLDDPELPLRAEDAEFIKGVLGELFKRSDYVVRDGDGEYIVQPSLMLGRTLDQTALCVVPHEFWGGYEAACRIAAMPGRFHRLLGVVATLVEEKCEIAEEKRELTAREGRLRAALEQIANLPDEFSGDSTGIAARALREVGA